MRRLHDAQHATEGEPQRAVGRPCRGDAERKAGQAVHGVVDSVARDGGVAGRSAIEIRRVESDERGTPAGELWPAIDGEPEIAVEAFCDRHHTLRGKALMFAERL